MNEDEVRKLIPAAMLPDESRVNGRIFLKVAKRSGIGSAFVTTTQAIDKPRTISSPPAGQVTPESRESWDL